MPEGGAVVTSGEDGRLIQWKLKDRWPPVSSTLVDLKHTRGEPFTFSSPKLPDLKVLAINEDYFVLERDPGAGKRQVGILSRHVKGSEPDWVYESKNNIFAIFASFSESGRWLYIKERESVPAVLVDLKKPGESKVARIKMPIGLLGFTPNETSIVTHSHTSGRLTVRSLEDPASIADELSSVGMAAMNGNMLYAWFKDSTFQRFHLSTKGALSKEGASLEIDYVNGASLLVAPDSLGVVFGIPGLPYLDLRQSPPQLSILDREATGETGELSLHSFKKGHRFAVTSPSNWVAFVEWDEVLRTDGVQLRRDPLSQYANRPLVSDRWIAFSLGEKGVRIYDTSSTDPIGEAMVFSHVSNFEVAFSPDGRFLLGQDLEHLRIWPLEVSEALKAFRMLHQPGMTQEEWKRFFPYADHQCTFQGIDPLTFGAQATSSP